MLSGAIGQAARWHHFGISAPPAELWQTKYCHTSSTSPSARLPGSLKSSARLPRPPRATRRAWRAGGLFRGCGQHALEAGHNSWRARGGGLSGRKGGVWTEQLTSLFRWGQLAPVAWPASSTSVFAPPASALAPPTPLQATAGQRNATPHNKSRINHSAPISNSCQPAANQAAPARPHMGQVGHDARCARLVSRQSAGVQAKLDDKTSRKSRAPLSCSATIELARRQLGGRLGVSRLVIDRRAPPKRARARSQRDIFINWPGFIGTGSDLPAGQVGGQSVDEQWD